MFYDNTSCFVSGLHNEITSPVAQPITRPFAISALSRDFYSRTVRTNALAWRMKSFEVIERLDDNMTYEVAALAGANRPAFFQRRNCGDFGRL